MKVFYIFISVLLCFSSCNATGKRTDNKSVESITDSVKMDQPKDTLGQSKDQINWNLAGYFIKDGSWVQIKDALSTDQTGIYLYFQTEHDVARNLRLRIQYANSSEFQFEIDGKKYSYKANRSQNSSTVFVDGDMNWYDNSVKKDDLKFIETLIKSKSAILILSDGSSVTITDRTKTNMQKTLDYFESLDGLLPKSKMVNIRRL